MKKIYNSRWRPFQYWDCYVELTTEIGKWEKQQLEHQDISYIRGIVYGLRLARSILKSFHLKRL